jgi:hypothetical protein
MAVAVEQVAPAKAKRFPAVDHTCQRLETQECAWCEKDKQWKTMVECTGCDYFEEGPGGYADPYCSWKKRDRHWLYDAASCSAEEFPRITLGCVRAYVDWPEFSAEQKLRLIDDLLCAYAEIMTKKMGERREEDA